MESKQSCLLIILLFLSALISSGTVNVNISLSTDRILRSIDPTKFLSFTLDTSFVRGNFCGINWIYAILLMRSLAPSYLRLGGDDSDFLIFQSQFSEQKRKNAENENENDNDVVEKYDRGTLPAFRAVDANGCDMFAHSFFNMTPLQFDRINWLKRSSGIRLVFDLNLILGTEHQQQNGTWNCSNVIELLDYAQLMGYDMDFELGNEPDDFPYWYNVTMSGRELVNHYGEMRKLLDKYPLFKKSKLIGPAVGSPFSRQYKQFIQAGGLQYVDAITFHHYYGAGDRKLSFFVNPKVLDSLKPNLERAVSLVKKYGKGRRDIWLGETASCYGGGTEGLSGAYVAGFMWLDKLGLGALMGLDAIFRHTFFMGNYAMTNNKTLPRPDYWLSLAFKTIVGSDVHTAVIEMDSNDQSLFPYIRFYGHSNGTHLTLFGMNLLNSTVIVTVPNYKKVRKIEQFLMEPKGGRLESQTALLNGIKLNFDGKNQPNIANMGVRVEHPFRVPPMRYGFWIFPLKH